MQANRRAVLTGGMLSVAAAALTSANAGEVAVAAQTKDAPSTEEVSRIAAANRYRLNFTGGEFSGPAWDRLVQAGRDSHFFVIGEEHGIAENPRLAAALFQALVPAGYSRLAIEISPPMAAELDRTLAHEGVEGLRRYLSDPQAWVAFYTLHEESELLAAARKAVGGREPVLWGLDYEVGADRRLIQLLKQYQKPAAAASALAILDRASAESWAQYQETRNPQFIYSFAGDPSLVRSLRATWPDAPAWARTIMDALEKTFEINRLWVAGDNYGSNQLRADYLRENFLRHWDESTKQEANPRVMLKFGAAHVVRGLNSNDAFDLGALVPEVAALNGGESYHVLVLSGAGRETANFDPSAFNYRAGQTSSYARGMGPIVEQAWPDAFTMIDLRPLRATVRSSRDGWHPELVRNVHGFDAVVILSGSTPSSPLY